MHWLKNVGLVPAIVNLVREIDKDNPPSIELRNKQLKHGFLSTASPISSKCIWYLKWRGVEMQRMNLSLQISAP